MACSGYRGLVLGLLAFAVSCGVGRDPEVVEVDDTGLDAVILREAADAPSVDERWELAELPSASDRDVVVERNGFVFFEPDVRGLYVVEHWLQLGVNTELTKRFIIDVPGLPGEPYFVVSGAHLVGLPMTADGADSKSPEGLPLSYQWRLAERPRASAAMLDNDVGSQISFVPDVAGQFVITLSVFDGQLWSGEATVKVEVEP